MSLTARGNPTTAIQYGTGTNTAYLTTGIPYEMSDGDGMVVSVAAAGSTAYSLPSSLTPNSNANLATSMSYSASFALTSVTGANGATQSVNYDIFNRPSNSTSVDGATTNYTYT